MPVARDGMRGAASEAVTSAQREAGRGPAPLTVVEISTQDTSCLPEAGCRGRSATAGCSGASAGRCTRRSRGRTSKARSRAACRRRGRRSTAPPERRCRSRRCPGGGGGCRGGVCRRPRARRAGPTGGPPRRCRRRARAGRRGRGRRRRPRTRTSSQPRGRSRTATAASRSARPRRRTRRGPARRSRGGGRRGCRRRWEPGCRSAGTSRRPAGRLARQRRPPEALVPARRTDAAALRAVEHHERVRLSLVRLLLLHVREADHLVAPVAVEVGHRRRRCRPLQPRGRAHVGPRPGVPVIVVPLDPRAQPADELAPAETGADVAALTVHEPRRGEHRRAVVVEDVDLVVVERDDDLQLRVVVELADADVLAVGAVAVVADAVEARVVAVVPRPRARRPIQAARRVEDEHLRSRRRRVRRRRHHLDAAVPVEVRRRHAARLGALPAAAGRRGPAGLQAQLPARQCVRRAGAVVATDDDLARPVAVEVGDDARGVHAPRGRRALAEKTPLGVVDERAVERRDDLQPAVAVEIDEARRGEPAGLAGRDVALEPRLGGSGLGPPRRRERDKDRQYRRQPPHPGNLPPPPRTDSRTPGMAGTRQAISGLARCWRGLPAATLHA